MSQNPDELDHLIDQYGPALVCEALTPLMQPERIARIEAVLDARLATLTTLVEDVYDPHNAAAAIRSSEALGLQEFHAVEPERKFAPAGGITLGCHKWIDIHRWTRTADCIASLQTRGFRVYATLPGAPFDVENVDVSGPLALAFGNEHGGLTKEAIAACDGAVSIAMYGFTQSFNLSVSVALAQSRLAARRRAHLGGHGDLNPARRARLRARWFALKVRGAAGVVERFVSDGTQRAVAPDPQSRENDHGG